jgi:hypothetical protein
VSEKKLTFDTGAMFMDPGFTTWSQTGGWEGSSRSVNTLTFGGKVLAKKTTTDWKSGTTTFAHKIKKSGWYTLTTVAKRYRPGMKYPAGMLSTTSSASFRFWANPKVPAMAPVLLTRFVPAGLDIQNRARPGSITRVALRPNRNTESPEGLPKIKVKSVSAKASFDGGKTWKVVTVKRSGTTWTALVGNPAAGAVALRAKITDTKGNSAEVTVYRAYAIG